MEKQKGTTRERMKEALQVLGVSAFEFENKCGLAHGFAARVSREITKKSRSKIKDVYPNLNIDYIAFGIGEIFIKEGEAKVSIKERILQFCEHMNITKKAFIKKTGISDAFIQNMSNNIRKSSLDKIYHAYPKLNPEWLEYGEGTMLLDKPKKTDAENTQDRIGKLIDFLGITKLSFVSETGFNTKNKNVTKRTVDRIVKRYPFVNPLWLMHGTGNMICTPPKAVKHNFKYAPLVSQRAFAGYLMGFADDDYLDTLDKVPYIEDDEMKGNIVAIEVSGDSMDDGTSESYRNGDVILAKEILKSDPLPYTKYDFVIVHKAGILVKRIIKDDRAKGTVTIHSLNKDYGDIELNDDDILKLFIVTMRITKTKH